MKEGYLHYQMGALTGAYMTVSIGLRLFDVRPVASIAVNGIMSLTSLVFLVWLGYRQNIVEPIPIGGSRRFWKMASFVTCATAAMMAAASYGGLKLGGG